MKKKIVALLCAAALAFGVPATAFGVSAEKEGDTAVVPDIVADGITIKNMKIEGMYENAVGVDVELETATPSDLPANTLPNSVSICTIKIKGNNLNTILNSAGPSSSVTFNYVLGEKFVSELPDVVDADNIYLCGNFVRANGTAGATFGPQKMFRDGGSTPTPALTETTFTAQVRLEGAASGSFTLWAQNGAYATSPDVNTVRPLPVPGNSGVEVRGDLTVNPEDVAMSAEKLTTGQAFDELRAAVRGGSMLGVFEVNMKVLGVPKHKDFGSLELSFPVGAAYDGRTVIVWHLHNDGSLTSDRTKVENGMATITVTDLSSFGIELAGGGYAYDPNDFTDPSDTSDDPSAEKTDKAATSPKTGQSLPSGVAPAALGVTLVLGGAALLARRKMTR